MWTQWQLSTTQGFWVGLASPNAGCSIVEGDLVMKSASRARNFVAAVLGSAALMASSGASAIVVGGVDFGALGETQHLETTTIAETFINDTGQLLEGYGVVDRVNGNLNYAGTNKLFFHFYNYQTSLFDSTNGEVGFIGGMVDVYLGANINFLDRNSPDNITLIQGYTPWVRLAGHLGGFTNPAGVFTLGATGTLVGETIGFTGSGLLDVDVGAWGLAAVQDYLNSNTIDDLLGGFADIELGTSANNRVLNPFDVADGLADGCDDGTAEAGAWCLQGSADLRGDTVVVPEPTTAVLLGVALLGLGAVSRKRVK